MWKLFFLCKKNGEDAVIDKDYRIEEGIITFYTQGSYTLTMTNDAIVSYPDYPAIVIAEFLCVNNVVGIFDNAQEQLTCYVQNGILHIGGLLAGESWSVYSASGMLVEESENEFIMLPSKGVYIVQAGKRTVKVIF